MTTEADATFSADASGETVSPKTDVSWATVTTLKETPETVMNFVAQHIYQGAAEIFLFFDDPADPSFDLVCDLPQVRAFRCDAAYWAAAGQRPERHQARQKANANIAYGLSQSDWILHLDADELISSPRPVAAVLAEATADILRVRPFEAMTYAKAGENGRPSHYFRGSLPQTPKGQRIAEVAYGEFRPCMYNGMLSHSVGKFFVRTRLPGVKLSIHAPFEGGERRKHRSAPGVKLLHFHGGDYQHWRARVEYRLEKGAYMSLYQNDREDREGTLHATLNRLKQEEGEAGLKRFYKTVCTFGPDKSILKRNSALHRENLWLEAKRAAVFPDQPDRLTGVQLGQAGFEANVEWNGIHMRVVPDSNYTECKIARGQLIEPDELEEVRQMITGRRVLFYDVGANAGIYSLTVAKHADAASKILAYEPNPEMQRRFARNVALNGFDNVVLRPVALADAPGRAVLNVTSYGNLGQASLARDGAGINVEVACLPDEMLAPDGYDLSFMKIDVEGGEAMVLQPALNRNKVHWPDVIMMEHKSAKEWGVDLFAALAGHGYAPRKKTANNTFLYRERD